MRNTFILYDEHLNKIQEKHYACGSCGKRGKKTDDRPWTMNDKHGKIIWKNEAYKRLENEN